MHAPSLALPKKDPGFCWEAFEPTVACPISFNRNMFKSHVPDAAAAEKLKSNQPMEAERPLPMAKPETSLPSPPPAHSKFSSYTMIRQGRGDLG